MNPPPLLATIGNRALAPCAAFQAMVTQAGQPVNIILVRVDMGSRHHELYRQYKDEILFIGISSFEDFPLCSNFDIVVDLYFPRAFLRQAPPDPPCAMRYLAPILIGR